jgi:molybdopterin-guanine dinucleotide biosynthesis protein A
MSEGQDILGVIVAGGRATRLGGGDKCLLPFRGGVILDHVIVRLRPQVAALTLNANGDPGRFAAFGLPVIADSLPGVGPLAGVLAALEWATAVYPRARYVLTTPGDTPFLPLDLGVRLEAALRQHQAAIAIPTTGGLDHPLASLWSVHLADDLRAALIAGTRKVTDWANRHPVARVAFDHEPRAFFNINTPEDLAAAKEP